MYYYIYHSDLKKNKHSKLIINIETKLNKLGLDGKTIKLGVYASLEERIQELDFTSKDTLVVVGDDELFFNTINLIGSIKNKPLLGYIPIFQDSNLTQNLGLPAGDKAVMVVANRRVENLDLGQIGEDFFLESIKILKPNVELEFNGKFNAQSPSGTGEIEILNLKNLTIDLNQQTQVNPRDGQLEVIFIENKKGLFQSQTKKINSFFRGKKIYIKSLNGEVDLLVDNYKTKKTPQEVIISKNKLKLIVGKNRLIN